MEIINISLIKPTTIHCQTKYKMFLRPASEMLAHFVLKYFMETWLDQVNIPQWWGSTFAISRENIYSVDCKRKEKTNISCVLTLRFTEQGWKDRDLIRD